MLKGWVFVLKCSLAALLYKQIDPKLRTHKAEMDQGERRTPGQ